MVIWPPWASMMDGQIARPNTVSAFSSLPRSGRAEHRANSESVVFVVLFQ